MNGRHEGAYDDQSTPDRPLSEGSSVDDNEIKIHQFASLIHQQQLLISQLEKQGRRTQRQQLEANLYLNPSLPEALRDHARMNSPPAKTPTPQQPALPPQPSIRMAKVEKDYFAAPLHTPCSVPSMGSTPSIVQVSSEGSWTPTPQFAADAKRTASSPAIPCAMLPPPVSEAGRAPLKSPEPLPASVQSEESVGNAYQVLVTSTRGPALLEDIETVQDIILGVQAVLAVPVQQQVLLFKGEEMQPSASLEALFATESNPVKVVLKDLGSKEVVSPKQDQPHVPIPAVLPPSLSHSLVLSPSSDVLRKAAEAAEKNLLISTPISLSDTSASGSPRSFAARDPSPKQRPEKQHLKNLPSLILDPVAEQERRDRNQPILRQKERRESPQCESCKGCQSGRRLVPSPSVVSKDEEMLRILNETSMKQSKGSIPPELEFQATQQVPHTSGSGASLSSRPAPVSLTRTYSQKPEQAGIIRSWKNGAKSFQRDWPHQVAAVAYQKNEHPVLCCANRGAPCLRVIQLGAGPGKELSSIPFNSVQTVATDGELVVIGGEGALACYNVTTGQFEWKADTPEWEVIAAGGDSLVIGTHNGPLSLGLTKQNPLEREQVELEGGAPQEGGWRSISIDPPFIAGLDEGSTVCVWMGIGKQGVGRLVGSKTFNFPGAKPAGEVRSLTVCDGVVAMEHVLTPETNLRTTITLWNAATGSYISNWSHSCRNAYDLHGTRYDGIIIVTDTSSMRLYKLGNKTGELLGELPNPNVGDAKRVLIAGGHAIVCVHTSGVVEWHPSAKGCTVM